MEPAGIGPAIPQLYSWAVCQLAYDPITKNEIKVSNPISAYPAKESGTYGVRYFCPRTNGRDHQLGAW